MTLTAPVLKPEGALPFAQRFEQECTVGSAIALELFTAAIAIVPDLVVFPSGDVETPIHDALNWTYRRFGNQANAAQTAALFLNESEEPWQAKLEFPCFDPQKGKVRKYETPYQQGSRAFLPEIPPPIRDQIAARYHITVPHNGSFWRWLETHPEMPIIWTEGGKKALSLLSQGYVAIALYGVCGGYRRNRIDETRRLIPDVDRFCQPGRKHVLAFDQDEKLETRQKVGKALLRFGSLLEATGGTVSIMRWRGAKGIDDYIVTAGPVALETAYQNAGSLCHWRLEHSLFRPLQSPASLTVDAPDLSTLTPEQIPAEGIIAILSAKGTGKTKLLRSLVAERDKVLSATFRIALGRNLANRVGLDWRGDLDKVQGAFINGAGYTLRVGFCVDSLLAINPEQFRGCDLIIDEVVQVLRHLLTSSTCATGGKRPALLARFHELLQVARRVLIADADLSDDVLQYLQTLRGDARSPFLVRNNYQPYGYPVEFLEAPDRTAITQQLLTAVAELPEGNVIFVATDSKATSQAIAQIIQRVHPEKRVLLINSETSGGAIEREFIQAPDTVLTQNRFDVVVSSPSMATGISIEVQGVIAEVFGIFTGVSGTDADLSQALSRVREPVPRVVWCAQKGNNFAKVSASSNVREIKEQLRQSTAATVRLIRSNLREDTAVFVDRVDWDSDPHLHLYCALSADQNQSMHHLRDALRLRLQREGNGVTVQRGTSDAGIQAIFKQTRQEQREHTALAIAQSQDLSDAEVTALQDQRGESSNGKSDERLTPEEHRAIEKWRLKAFYRLDTVTPEDVVWDQDGKRRLEILALEVQLEPSLASERTIKSLEQQLVWKKSLCPWDVNHLTLRQALRQELGLTALIQAGIAGAEWANDDPRIIAIAQKARQLSREVKVGLRFSIHPKMYDLQIVHELLLQLGLKVEFRWTSHFPGHEGKKIRVYSLDRDHWAKVQKVLERRRQWRNAGSPLHEELINDTGDPDADTAADSDGDLLEAALEPGEAAIAVLWQEIPEASQANILLKLPPGMSAKRNSGQHQRDTEKFG